MLDAYIIDRIRREKDRERRDGGFIPLHIEPTRPDADQEPRRRPEQREESDERGSVIIDFSC